MANKPYGKGPWNIEEDNKLFEWVKTHGEQQWSHCSDTIPGRSGKQCREHWFNYLNPNLKKGNWTAEEDDKIFKGYLNCGSSWSVIAKNLEGRTENSVKNRFYSTVRKLLSDQEKNGVKASQQEIRNIIEKMSLKQNVGEISSKDANEDENSLDRDISNILQIKNEESYYEQQQQITEDLNMQDPQNVAENENENEVNNNIQEEPTNILIQNIKQEQDVVKIEAGLDTVLFGLIKKEAGTTSNENIEPQQNSFEKPLDDQLGEINNQEHCLEEMNQHPPNNFVQGVTKRKYTKRKQQDDYSQSNFLYHLLKSNDVEIKNSKCLQDYSVFYRNNKHIKKQKQLNQMNQKDVDRNEEMSDNEEDIYEENTSFEEEESEQLNGDVNQPERDSKLKTQNKKVFFERNKSKLEKATFGENLRKKLKINQTKEKYFQQQDRISNYGSDLSGSGSQVEQEKLKQSDFNKGIQKRKTNSIKKQKDDDTEDDNEDKQGENFGEMESQLIKYFQKSMGKFLKKFLKQSKITNSFANAKDNNGKTSFKKKNKANLQAEHEYKKQQNIQYQVKDQFKEQISKEFDKKLQKKNSPQNMSDDSVEIIEEMSTFKTAEYKKINKPSISVQNLPCKKMESLPLNNIDSQIKKELKVSTIQVQSTFSSNHPQQIRYSSESSGISTSNRQSTSQTLPNTITNLQSQKSSVIPIKDINQFHESLPKLDKSSNLHSQPLNNKSHDGDSIQRNKLNVGDAQQYPENNTQIEKQNAIISQNIAKQNLTDLTSNNIIPSNSPGQSSAVSKEQVDQKMIFLLNQLCTLESMLTNTKQELGKLESSIYQRTSDTQAIPIQNGMSLMYNVGQFPVNASTSQQQALTINQMAAFKARSNVENDDNNSNNLILQRQNSKDNVFQYSDLDKFIIQNN